jgi:hypothetical protein
MPNWKQSYEQYSSDQVAKEKVAKSIYELEPVPVDSSLQTANQIRDKYINKFIKELSMEESVKKVYKVLRSENGKLLSHNSGRYSGTGIGPMFGTILEYKEGAITYDKEGGKGIYCSDTMEDTKKFQLAYPLKDGDSIVFEAIPLGKLISREESLPHGTTSCYPAILLGKEVSRISHRTEAKFKVGDKVQRLYASYQPVLIIEKAEWCMEHKHWHYLSQGMIIDEDGLKFAPESIPEPKYKLGDSVVNVPGRIAIAGKITEVSWGHDVSEESQQWVYTVEESGTSFSHGWLESWLHPAPKEEPVPPFKIGDSVVMSGKANPYSGTFDGVGVITGRCAGSSTCWRVNNSHHMHEYSIKLAPPEVWKDVTGDCDVLVSPPYSNAFHYIRFDHPKGSGKARLLLGKEPTLWGVRGGRCTSVSDSQNYKVEFEAENRNYWGFRIMYRITG